MYWVILLRELILRDPTAHGSGRVDHSGINGDFLLQPVLLRQDPLQLHVLLLILSSMQPTNLRQYHLQRLPTAVRQQSVLYRLQSLFRL